jgi:hypothetical protein
VLHDRGVCLPGRQSGQLRVRPDDLAELALSGLQPQAIKVRLLEMSGVTLEQAMDKLAVERGNQYKIRRQLWSFDHKPAGR